MDFFPIFPENRVRHFMHIVCTSKCSSGQITRSRVQIWLEQGGIQLTIAQHFVAQSFIITIPLSQYNSNNVEGDVKHQIIIKLSAMKTIHMKWHALFSGEKKIRKMVQKTIL